jgi:hypothetical protein
VIIETPQMHKEFDFGDYDILRWLYYIMLQMQPRQFMAVLKQKLKPKRPNI